MSPTRIHLSIVQPAGFIHSLGFLDQARYLRHQLRRLGAEVSLAKNRLREDAVNIVFGAHLGFEPELLLRYSCIFFNLEQVAKPGQGGAELPTAYRQLLKHAAVIDYDAENLAAYVTHEAPLIVPFGFAPYLHPERSPALEDRPIDLLFFGSMNPRRQAFIDRIEASGRQVAAFDQPLYGEERDSFIRQAKAVVNCHFYESSRFEQARASHCLSLGTPFISERGLNTRPHAGFEDAVFWLDSPRTTQRFFSETFGTPAFYAEAMRKLMAFQRHDPIEACADLMAFIRGFREAHVQGLPQGPWQPKRINLGSGKDYKPGWLNIDVLDRAEPDLVLDLGRDLAFPVQAETRFGGRVELAAGSVSEIYANNVLEHVPDLPCLMGNALDLLEVGGVFDIEVPYEKSTTAWQDPTHLRALNENSWLYYTDWFWYLGWLEHRFEMAASAFLDLQLRPCPQAQAAFMRVKLKKVVTSNTERMQARVMRADFGGVPDDLDVSHPVETRGPLEAPRVAFHPAAAPQPWLVLSPPHHDQVTDNFGRAIAAGLIENGQPAEFIDISQPAQLRRLTERPAAVLTIGTLPLELRMDGRLLHQALSCPVYAYFLDSPIYDLARVAASRSFVEDAWNDPRLVPVLAERSYLDLLTGGPQALLPPQSLYMPFAAFPAQETHERRNVPMQRRLLVVGSLGQELAGDAVRADLSQTLRDANKPALSGLELTRLAEQLLKADARGNCAADALDALAFRPRALLDLPLLNLICAGDSFVKRARRVWAVHALRGQPVDFIGPGWEQAFGKEKEFRFLGSVGHGDLAPLMGLYRGLLNFDPNWEWGMHDRVYTALNMGVPVMTHANGAIAEEGLAGPLVHTFAPNAPAPLAKIGAELLASKRPAVHAGVPLSRIGWAARLRTTLLSPGVTA